MFDPTDDEQYPINGPLKSWRDGLDNPGASQMQLCKRLVESRPFLTRIPDMELIVPDAVSTSVPGAGTRRFAATRDQEGTYAFVYFPIGCAATINIGRLSARTLRAFWYDPRNGTFQEIGEFPNEGRRTFAPPTLGEDLDMVLVIDDASKNYPPAGIPLTNALTKER